MTAVRHNSIRLNVNENFYGCSPNVLKIIRPNIRNVHQYPDSPHRLKEKLAERWNIKPDNVIVGAGSVRLIDGIIQTFVEQDGEVITFENTFPAYAQLTAAHGRKCLLAGLTDFVCCPDNILPLITSQTKVIFIANPNNPTGTIITQVQLQKFLERIPQNTFVVIDEAYYEYVTDSSYPNSLALQLKHPNLIILRTFSKIYGLAGLRIGYAIASVEVAQLLKKKRIPFFLNYLAEKAALTALDAQDFIVRCAAENKKQREWLYEALTELDLQVVQTQANFLYILFSHQRQKDVIYNSLLENSIQIRNMSDFGVENALRITVGDAKVNRLIIKHIRCHMKLLSG